MIIAYDFFGEDSMNNMWDKPLPQPRCPNCGLITGPKRINPNYKVKKKLDVSYTFDGYLIVSKKVKDIFESMSLEGLIFYDLPSSQGHYYLCPENKVRFDVERRKTRFSEPCETCGQSTSIIGATPVCLMEESIANEGVFRTDISFGENDSKFPIIVIGVETYNILIQNNLTGLDTNKILSKYDWE